MENRDPDTETFTYGGKDFVVPQLSAMHGFTFLPEPKRPVQMLHPGGKHKVATDTFCQYMHTVWDQQQFETGDHKPVRLGVLDNDLRGKLLCTPPPPQILSFVYFLSTI